jgi:glycerate kinase
MQYLELDRLIGQADLVITAEGSLDEQTPFGKVPAEVAQRAKRHGLPVIALAGTLGKGVRLNLDHGIDAFTSILKRPCTLDKAIAEAGTLLRRAAEDALRMVCVGVRMRPLPHPADPAALVTHRRARRAGLHAARPAASASVL